MKKNNWVKGQTMSFRRWKILLIMKLLAVFILGFLLQSHAIVSNAQNKRITLRFENSTLKEVLQKLEDDTEFSFIYKDEQINSANKISGNFKEEKVSELLDKILKSENLTYTVAGRVIVILPNNSDLSIFQQQKSISGKVTDSTGASLPGVSVIVKGSTIGVITDMEGKYFLSNVSENATLQFSFVGMKMKEIVVGSKTLINLILEEETIGIDEVVAIGYGVVKKSDLTGSVSSLSNEKFNPGAIASPTQALQGKISGVNISLNSGQPGANSVVRVRGGTSINGGNNPLYVIDGVPIAFSEDNFSTGASLNPLIMTKSATNPLNMINPSDIESIDVLKDASAAAIYGSRGANGVILVTTKQGKGGKNTIDFESYYGVSSIRRKLPVLNASEYRSFLTNNPDIKNWTDGGASTDWQDQIFKSAVTQSYSTSMTGGNDKTNYRLSINYFDQDGIISGSGMNKLTGKVNINHSVGDRLKISFNLANALENEDNVPNPEFSGGDKITGVIKDALRFNPTFPVKDEKGEFLTYSLFVNNPVAEIEQLQDITKINRMLGSINANFKLTDYLNFYTNAGFTQENIFRGIYEPKINPLGAQYGGRASQIINGGSSKLIETNINFNKEIVKYHIVSALVGYSFQQFEYTSMLAQSQGFISDATSYNDLDGGTIFPVPATGRNDNKLISFYGRANYNLYQKYLLTATVRKDGSSRFGKNNKWGMFPSVAFAWRITEEDYFKKLKVISNLKLRLGYGVTGNQEIGNYLSLPTLAAGSTRYMFGSKVVTAIGANQYYNPDLKWESTAQSNIGIDFGFLENRFSGSVDYYIKTTSDLLLSFAVPSPAEVTTTTANVGKVENKGLEFELNAVILKDGILKWDFYGNISANKNKVLSLSNDTWKSKDILTAVEPNGKANTQIIREGLPLGTFYGPKYTGVDTNGKATYLDENNDKIADLVVLGSNQPDFLYGFGTNLAYRNFSLNIFFRGVHGIDVHNATAQENQHISKLPGMNVFKESISEGIKFGDTPMIFSGKYIQDASFLRMENIQLDYDLNIRNVTWVKKANIYLNAQNLFVITKYIGFDPEVPNGVDYNVYPRPRTITLGVKFQF